MTRPNRGRTWERGFNDGMVCAIEELLMLRHPDYADLLAHHVDWDEVPREKRRALLRLTCSYGGTALEVARLARAADRGTP